jgi:hypothetical protein
LILRLVNNAVSSAASKKWDGNIVNAEQIRIWKEMVIACFTQIMEKESWPEE